MKAAQCAKSARLLHTLSLLRDDVAEELHNSDFLLAHIEAVGISSSFFFSFSYHFGKRLDFTTSSSQKDILNSSALLRRLLTHLRRNLRQVCSRENSRTFLEQMRQLPRTIHIFCVWGTSRQLKVERFATVTWQNDFALYYPLIFKSPWLQHAGKY